MPLWMIISTLVKKLQVVDVVLAAEVAVAIKTMKLKKLLTTATCALLGTAIQADESEWAFDTAFMYYSETDRVSAAEAIISAAKTFENDEILNLKLTIDSLTGASANGAVVCSQVDESRYIRAVMCAGNGRIYASSMFGSQPLPLRTATPHSISGLKVSNWFTPDTL